MTWKPISSDYSSWHAYTKCLLDRRHWKVIHSLVFKKNGAFRSVLPMSRSSIPRPRPHYSNSSVGQLQVFHGFHTLPLHKSVALFKFLSNQDLWTEALSATHLQESDILKRAHHASESQVMNSDLGWWGDEWLLCVHVMNIWIIAERETGRARLVPSRGEKSPNLTRWDCYCLATHKAASRMDFSWTW